MGSSALGRSGHKKSRYGCLQCKRRKVKVCNYVTERLRWVDLTFSVTSSVMRENQLLESVLYTGSIPPLRVLHHLGGLLLLTQVESQPLHWPSLLHYTEYSQKLSMTAMGLPHCSPQLQFCHLPH